MANRATLNLIRDRAALLTVLWLVSIFCFALPLPGYAANCCRCRHAKVTEGEFCIKDELDCGKLATANKDLAEANCETIPPEKSAQCAKLGTGGGICLNDPIDALSFRLAGITKSSGSAASAKAEAAITPLPMTLNVDIQGLTKLDDPFVQGNTVVVPFLAQYVNALIKFLMGAGLVAAATMIVWGGMEYIVAGSGAQVKSGKGIIIDAVIGLVIILCSYVILANINPATTNFGALTLEVVMPKTYEPVSPEQYGAAAAASGIKGISGTLPTPSEIFAYAKERAKEKNVDPCIPYAILMAESRGRVLIGHDENQYFGAHSLIQARLDFIRSRKFASGKPFEASVPSMPPLCGDNNRTVCATAAAYPMDPVKVADGQFKNDDELDMSKAPDYGLDWRFSHGIGASQGTIFTNSPRCPDGNRGYTVGGKCFTIAQLLTKEGAVDSILAHGAVKPGADPKSVFCAYGGKSLANCGPIEYLVKHKMDAYAQCQSSR